MEDSREELLAKRTALRQELNLINTKLVKCRLEDNEHFVGKYYYHEDSAKTEVWFSVTGVDTEENVKCDMIVVAKDDNTDNISISKGGFTPIGYLTTEITVEQWNATKSMVIAHLNTML